MILNLPYSSLRVFEVMVRHATFSAAAEELGISQSAVSQHVKLLEDWVGQELITRGGRRSIPTAEGRLLGHAVATGLGQISDVCQEIRDKKRANNSIVISCLPGFAFIWLFPRLQKFDQAHPEMSISINTDTGDTVFDLAQADIGIRYGVYDRSILHVERLMGEVLFPVCAPSLLVGSHPLRTIADLAYHTQLRDELGNTKGKQPSWEYWAAENDIALPRPARIRNFGQSNMVVQAAIDGAGVALGRSPLVLDALSDGRLIRPFHQTANSHLSYWLVCTNRKRNLKKAKLFMDWIKRANAEQPELPPCYS